MVKSVEIVLWNIIVIATGLIIGCEEQPKTWTDADMKKKANELAKKYMIVDTHQDVPYRLTKKMEDISQRTEKGEFDYPRARQGGLDVVFMAVYVPHEYEDKGGAKAFAEKIIGLTEGLAGQWPNKFIMARSVADVKEQFGGNEISIVMGMENGSPVEGNLDNLKYFYNRGIRYITLVHSKCNHICDSSFDEQRKWNGLSPFGKDVVSEMNRLGMLIDVSHVSDETFYQIIELSKAPVAATHSCCRHFTPGFERNMDDEMIKLLAEKGGVIQINFGSMFVSEKINRAYKLRRKNVLEYIEANNLEGEARYVGITKSRKLVYVKAFSTRPEAIIREKRIKKLGQRGKLFLTITFSKLDLVTM